MLTHRTIQVILRSEDLHIVGYSVSMWARLGRITAVSPIALDEILDMLEQVSEALHRRDGLQYLFLFMDELRLNLVTLTCWGSRDELDATEDLSDVARGLAESLIPDGSQLGFELLEVIVPPELGGSPAWARMTEAAFDRPAVAGAVLAVHAERGPALVPLTGFLGRCLLLHPARTRGVGFDFWSARPPAIAEPETGRTATTLLQVLTSR